MQFQSISLASSLSLALLCAVPVMAQDLTDTTVMDANAQSSVNPVIHSSHLAPEKSAEKVLKPKSIHNVSKLEQISQTLAESGFDSTIVTPTQMPIEAAPKIAQSPTDRPVSYRVSPQIGARFSSAGGGTSSFVGVEGFVPLNQNFGQNLTYLEGRLQLATDNGKLGGNLLLGHRFLTDSKQSILGAYVSYDNRNTGAASFNQFGAGFERLSDSFDVRGNVYLPIGDRRQLISSGLVGGLKFQGNQLGIDRLQGFQEAIPGFDLEVGTKLFNIGKKGSLRGYIGGYHYGGENSNFGGFRTRLVARPTDFLTAGITLQNDARYDTRLMFNVGIVFPGSGGGLSQPEPDRPMNPTPSLLARLGESPERQSSILVDQFLKKRFDLAINPATGQPWTFQFVTLGNQGDGTFEAPAGTVASVLPKAKSGAIVYVRAGTNPGIPSFTIPDGVTVLSSVKAEPIATQFGSIDLPNARTGNLPQIDGTVTLGNDTTLNGFDLLNSPDAGVQGTNVRNVTIVNNVIENSTKQGIILREVTGDVAIKNNNIYNIGSTDKSQDSVSAIALLNSSGSSQISIENNLISDSKGDGIFIRMSDQAQGTATINQNIVSDAGSVGIEVSTVDNSSFNSRITNNSVRNSLNSRGISVVSFNTSQNKSVISNNELFGNSIFVDSEQNSRLDTTISENTVVGLPSNNIPGIMIQGFDNSISTATIIGNTVSRFADPDFGDGIRAIVFDNAQSTVTIKNNTSTDNIRGITASANSTARLNVIIDGNTTLNNILEGITVTGASSTATIGTGTPEVAAIVKNNTATGNDISGQGFGDVASATFSPGARVCLRLDSNTIGVLTLADQLPGLLELPPPLSQLSGRVSVESPVGLLNPGNNTIGTVNLLSFNLWSRTNIPAGSCKLP